MVTDDDIKKLSGGGIIITSLLHHYHMTFTGDWHTAYILLYAPRRMEILPSS